MSSRLFQEAREKRGLCYTIFAQPSAWTETGVLMIYAGTGGDELGQLAGLVVDELSRAARDLGEAEVERAKTQSKASIVMALESPAARTERMAGLLSVWGEVTPIEETVAKIDAVDVTRARAVLGRIIESRPALALYGPVDGAPDADELARRLAG